MSTPLRILSSLAVLLALALPGAARAASPDAVSVQGQRFVDARGGDVLLRGGNVIDKATGLPDIDARDLEVMRLVGWTTIRLGTGWTWFEPQEGVYDDAFADRFAALARRLVDEGFRVVVDMHQDVWGRPHGNGAPAWTVPAACGDAHISWSSQTGAWSADYFSPWTACAFTRFWLTPSLQDHLIEVYRMLARRLGDEPGVVGYDLMNEPFPGLLGVGAFEYGALYPFYARAAGAIREIDRDAVIFEEPSVSKTVTAASVPPPRRDYPAAYAPHIYGAWDFRSDFPQQRDQLIEATIRASAAEARTARRPLWFGEFGIFNGTPGSERSMSLIFDLADALRAGTAMWELDSAAYGPQRPDGSLVQPRATTIARGYPLRVGGRLRAVEFDDATSRLTVRWRQQARAGRTELVLPRLRYDVTSAVVAAGPGVRVVAREPGRLVLDARPGVRVVTVRPG